MIRYLIDFAAVLAVIVLALAMARAMERYDAKRCEWDGEE